MGGILSSVLNSAKTLQVFDRQLNTIQNNVTNANTPGYVKQTQIVEPLPFDPERHLPGGTIAGPLVSSRSMYLEENVWKQNGSFGDAAQTVTDLSAIESRFGISSGSGVAASLSAFFKSYSQLSVNPNDTLSRQTVLDKADALAQSFRETAEGLSQTANDLHREASDTVSAINRVVGELQSINETRRRLGQSSHDAGVEAQVFAKLEELSSLADFTAIPAEDGSFTLFLGGQTPVLIGDRQYPISVDYAGADLVVLDSAGANISGQISGGKLASLLETKNKTLPSYLDDLNRLAASFADKVNAQHSLGVDRNGAAPVTPLFQYDPAIGAAFTIQVSSITTDELTAALASAPGGNGNAIAMGQLANAPVLDGVNATEFYGNLAARVGRHLSEGRDQKNIGQSLVAQAKDMRSNETGVSLDVEAANLIQVQRAYQATSQLVSVLNQLTETVLGILK